MLSWIYGASSRDDDIDVGSKKKFEGHGIGLPLLFKQGDIMKVVETEILGIAEAPIDEKEEAKMRKLAAVSDYSDFQVPVDYIFDGTKYLTVFAHEHVPPTEIEYTRLDDNDTRRGFLEYMKKTMYQSSCFDGTEREVGRIKEVLNKIEIVWNQYPDLRLGQLLVNVFGHSDLFSI